MWTFIEWGTRRWADAKVPEHWPLVVALPVAYALAWIARHRSGRPKQLDELSSCKQRALAYALLGCLALIFGAISCGVCFFCQQEKFSLCENSNPNAWLAEKMFGHAPSGIYGYSHLTGGFAGGQAEYARVPFADVGTLKIENGLSDEQVLFLSDIFPTGYMAAENCDIKPGDTVAVWGCGPVGQFAIRSCFMLGAERVIAIERETGLEAVTRIGWERLDTGGGRLGVDQPGVTGRGPIATVAGVVTGVDRKSVRPIGERAGVRGCTAGAIGVEVP